jgi:hypothetical protein
MASAKNSQYDDPPVYVALEGGQPIVAEQAQQPAFAYYVVPVEPRKRKQCGCGCCCLTTLFVFLMCFFLIPRTPTVYLDTLHISTDDESAVGTFSFTNKNYFKVRGHSEKATYLFMTFSPDAP